jgi:hypothetical protein
MSLGFIVVVTTLPLVFPDHIFGNNGQFQFLVISAGGGVMGSTIIMMPYFPSLQAEIFSVMKNI